MSFATRYPLLLLIDLFHRVVKELRRLLARYFMGEQDAVPVDLMQAAMKAWVQYGGVDEWNKVLEVYRQPPSEPMVLTAMCVPIFIFRAVHMPNCYVV